MLQDILVWSLSSVAVVGALGLLLHKNPLYNVLYLILNFFCIGGLFLTLNAEFLAVIQIIVYAGAIMVLFLFVIMLLNLGPDDVKDLDLDWRKGAAFILGVAFLAELVYAFSSILGFSQPQNQVYAYGKVEPIGRELMTSQLFSFEMISLILLSALMGAIVIAKKHKAHA